MVGAAVLVHLALLGLPLGPFPKTPPPEALPVSIRLARAITEAPKSMDRPSAPARAPARPRSREQVPPQRRRPPPSEEPSRSDAPARAPPRRADKPLPSESPSRPDQPSPALAPPAEGPAPSAEPGNASSPRDVPLPRLTRLPPGVKRAAPVASVEERLPEGLRRQKDGSYVYDAGVFVAKIAPDGSFWFEDREGQLGLPFRLDPGDEGEDVPESRRRTPHIVVFEAKFDITDTVMRAVGQDPYSHRKLTFVQETMALRARLREETLRHDLTAAVLALPARLRLIWNDAGLSHRQKRQLFFEIWDGSLTGKGPRGRAGAEVRAIVMDFLERHLRTAEERYPKVELVELSRTRSSSVAFLPPKR